MRSFVDDLPVTKTFENIELNGDKDIVVSFQVPPNLESLTAIATAEITNLTKSACEKLESSYSYPLTTHKSETTYFETYLRRVNNEYYFFLYGKAGEPIANADVDIITLNPLVASTKTFNEEFSTDKEGKVKLGALGEITWIQISGKKDDKQFNCTWNLPYRDESFNYTNLMQFLEGEDIVLPYPHDMFNSGCISLLQYDSKHIWISNKFDNIEYQKKEGHEHGDVSLKNLSSGYYELNFKKLNTTISIKILKGVYWESEEFILSNDTIYENTSISTIKRVTHYEINNSEDAKENLDLKTIKFKIDGGRGKLKVHAFASNTLHSSNKYMMNNWYPSIGCNLFQIFRFTKFENEYLCNKKLGDELRYALERKYLKSFIGTTLERPSLLQNKKYFCDTNFETDYGSQDQGYQRFTKLQPRAQNYNTYNIMKVTKEKLVKKNVGGYSGLTYYNFQTEQYVPQDYKSFYNFCDTPPLVVTNLKEKDGYYSLNLNTKLYSNLTILVIDSSGATQKIIDFDHSKSDFPQIRQRKIELDKPLSSELNYHETRNAI